MNATAPHGAKGPDPAPFQLEGGPVGVLLIHGFTGSPAELRLLGSYLHERGLTVSAPLLPGHGTTPEDLDECSYRDWIDHARGALEDLQDRCETVFVGGLSFGAAIALNVVADDPEVAGVLALSPAILVPDWQRLLIPVAALLLDKIPKPGRDVEDERAMEHIWAYSSYPAAATRELLQMVRRTRSIVPELSHPLLVVRSMGDRTVPPEAGRLLYERAAAQDKRLVTLHDSGHVVTVDREWRRVAEECWDFIRRRSVWHNDPRESTGTGD